MSSILTNNGAMVALQTMRSINKNMASVQSEISTGKSVSSAKDNAAVWAISKVMESDVNGLKAISDSLSLGESTVAVAREAAETTTELLNQMKAKIVAAQEDNVDRAKIDADVTALKEQIGAVVGAAQFNGLNLVDGSTASTSVLASLDRSGTGVSASSITVNAQNLSTGGYTAKASFTGTDGVAADSADAFGFSLDGNGGTDDNGTIVIANPTYATGDKITLQLGEDSVSYTVTDEDVASTTPQDVIAVNLKNAIEATDLQVTVDYNSANAGTLVVTNDGADSLQVSGQFTNANSGGLGALAAIDVSTDSGAAAALGNIEGLIDTAINAAASFGSIEGRIETQSEFISNLGDSLKSGIGAMVDADMEETSARLQALQVQQQLGVQALSIANQAPQTLLSLFR
ncbi:flagellin [Lutimaribacter sp. EGI FJ00015]|uniref:Flagellin n=1 Tax=Lutimaribacter degradans TaxID=2945989 RepID=A0ACC5ZU73_9RHOB|nr:flagellin [Lutimaribacter sp. EGI FJ00013]MCM2561889.1 flagellin [Lutimaribacter sp. EGI FJ00013]MCO0613079.1 flagellin [Lutimaribacter sp. EGI FJ00015]MCO0635721.1 flagellin [Lutimaribacter sp. EGI FJ00014]